MGFSSVLENNKSNAYGRTPGPGAPGWGTNALTAQPYTNTNTPTTTQPKTDMSVEDFSKWMQNNLSNQWANVNPQWYDQMQGVQNTMGNAYNNYANAAQGYGQMAGQLQGGMNQALQGYNAQNWNDIIATGQVPQATRDYYQGIRDNTVANVRSDLNNQYQDQMGLLKENYANKGIWDSTLAANAAGNIANEQNRLMSQASNQATAQMNQNLINAPYMMQNAAQSNMGAVLQNLISQGQLGASALTPLQNAYSMTGQLAQIPTLVNQNYQDPLMNMWSQLLSNETSRLIGSNGGSSDDGMWGAIGNIAGSLIGNLF